MKKIFGNKVVVTVLGFILCVGTLFFAYKYRVNKVIQPVNVPYAVRKLEARTLIEEDDVKVMKVAASMITDGVVRDKKEVIGKYVNYNTYIPEGSLFYSSSIVTWDEMPDSAWSDIEKGNTIVYLSATSTTTGSFIYPGDKIDLYYKTTDGGKLVYGKLIEGIKVLAVKDSSGAHIFKKTAAQKDFSTLIFSLSEDLHLLLRKASYVSGEIIPVTRNQDYCKDKECTKVTSEYLRNLIESQVDSAVQDTITEDDNKVIENTKVEDSKTKN